MTLLPTADLVSPELQALEAFLGSNPDELVAFTETPFASLLTRVNELGFDGDVIQAELASIGILDIEVWSNQVGLEHAEFLALSPIEYADRYPEQGAPLVAAVLNSIHLSEEQSALHAVAGGTNLNKGGKIGIALGATGVAISGLWLVPRMIKNHELIQSMKNACPEGQNVTDWVISQPGLGTLQIKNILGIDTVNFSADNFQVRLIHEWNRSLFGNIKEIKQRILNPPPEPEPQPEDLITIDSELERSSSSLIKGSILSDLSESNIRDPAVIRAIKRNAQRASLDPSRELGDLSFDLSSEANAGLRPKSLEVKMNSEFDSMAEAGLEKDAYLDIKVEYVDAADFENDIDKRSLKEFNNIESGKSQEFEEFESSVENNLKYEIGGAEQDINNAIDKEVRKDETFVVDKVDSEASKAEQAVMQEANTAVTVVEQKVDSAVVDLESDI